MRIPAFKIAAAKAVGVFKDDASVNYGLANTLDMEEAAAHGAAMKCALLSPKFRIQTTFDIIDAQMYPIKVSWDGSAPVLRDAPPLPPAENSEDSSTPSVDDVREMPTLPGGQSGVVYDRNAKCGAGRSGERKLHFQRSAEFSLEAAYHCEGNPSGEASIAKITVKSPPDVVNQNAASPPWITVSLQQDSNGLLHFNGASTIEAYIEEKTVKTPKKESASPAEAKADEGKKNESNAEGGKDGSDGSEAAPAEAEAASAEAEPEPAPVVKKIRKFRNLDVPVDVVYHGTGKSIMEAEEQEAKMAQQDRLIKETEDARNDLETYVYSMRDAIGMALKEYVTEEESTSFGALLAAEEEWLYTDEGYDGVKKTFVERLSKLQEVGGKFQRRETELNGREAAVQKLVSTMKKYKDIVTNANTADIEKYDHLTDEQRNEVVKKCDEVTSSLDAKKTEQAGLPKNVDPVLTLAWLKEQRQSVRNACSPIVNTPKPKPEAPEPKDSEASASKEGEEPKAPEAGAAAPGGKSGENDGVDEGKKDAEADAASQGENVDEGKKEGAGAPAE